MERTQEKICESERAGNSQIVCEKLSYAVIGCARRVHSALGPGFPEEVYHRALCRELNRAGIPFASEAPFEVVYAGEVCGRFQVDILVDSRIVLELKAASDICEDHVSQCYAYLAATGADLAILINFGQRRLQSRRLVMSKR